MVAQCCRRLSGAVGRGHAETVEEVGKFFGAGRPLVGGGFDDEPEVGVVDLYKTDPFGDPADSAVCPVGAEATFDPFEPPHDVDVIVFRGGAALAFAGVFPGVVDAGDRNPSRFEG